MPAATTDKSAAGDYSSSTTAPKQKADGDANHTGSKADFALTPQIYNAHPTLYSSVDRVSTSSPSPLPHGSWDSTDCSADAPQHRVDLAAAPLETSVTAVASSTRTLRPSPPPLETNRPRARSHHRKNAFSIDSSILPRQTIMKALVSRPPPTSNLSVDSTIQSLMTGNGSNINIVKGVEGDGAAAITLTRRERRLSEAFSEMHSASESSSSMAHRLAALRSPCFFHRRFDDAVDIERVLSELEEDAGMSHSKLLQTATGVREVSRQLQRRPIRRAVRNVMIVTKARDNELVLLTRELTQWLLETPRNGQDTGVNVYVDAKLRRSQRFGADSLLAQNPGKYSTMLRYWTPDLCWSTPEKFDLVLTLGGDGTVLYTSWLFQRIVPPILSFSLGSLGFLTNFEFRDFRPALNAIMGDEGMRVNMRMRFTCTVYRSNPTSTDSTEAVEAEQFEVLNELVIDRGPSPYVSNLELYGDDSLLTVVQADGVIFSTPTGSTAYSLSAGGSLVHPDIPAILLTPICPHTLSFRPMLLNDSMALRVAVPCGSRATAYCAFDGKGRVELRQGDYVTIAASQYPFPTVLSRPTEWFDSCGRTLRWNVGRAVQKSFVEGEEEKKEEGFDIDFGEEEEVDSGYSAEGSSAGVGGGGGSPRRKFSLF